MLLAYNTAGKMVWGHRAVKGEAYTCPGCGESPLVVKQGEIVYPHFAHKSGTACVGSEPETANHARAKYVLARAFGGMPEAVVGDRRADVLVPDWPGAGAFAVEVQLASMTGREAKARTRDWNRQGLPVMWVWGDQQHFKPAKWTNEHGREVAPARLKRISSAIESAETWFGRSCGVWTWIEDDLQWQEFRLPGERPQFRRSVDSWSARDVGGFELTTSSSRCGDVVTPRYVDEDRTLGMVHDTRLVEADPAWCWTGEYYPNEPPLVRVATLEDMLGGADGGRDWIAAHGMFEVSE